MGKIIDIIYVSIYLYIYIFTYKYNMRIIYIYMIYEYEDFQQAEFDYWTINIEISTGKTKHPILGEEKDGKGTQHTCPKTTNHLCIQITYAPLHHL